MPASAAWREGALLPTVTSLPTADVFTTFSAPMLHPFCAPQIGNFLQTLISAFTDNQTPASNQVGVDGDVKV